MFEKKRAALCMMWAAVLYVFISKITSSFFYPVCPNVGKENVAYRYAKTGSTLMEDTLSRYLCVVFSMAAAVLLLFLLFAWCYFLFRKYREEPGLRRWILVLLAINAAGIGVALLLYPTPIYLSADTFHNYAYAKEWLPMYWHGFLTNVIYCAAFLLIPHPVSMMLVPELVAINVICYLLFRMYRKAGRASLRMLIPFVGMLFLVPEMTQICLLVGRNYMYGILNLAFLGLLCVDRLYEKPLTKPRMIVYGLLAAMIVTWRSEGILWLIGYPLILILVYGRRSRAFSRKGSLQGILIFLVFFVLLNLPMKYGADKYQEQDYFIINLPGPLAAVLQHPNVNLSYDGAEQDMQAIEAVIPISYLKNFGDNASVVYNYENGRYARQSAAGEKGRQMVLSSYRFLLHNLDLFLKYQLNIAFQSLSLPPLFDDMIFRYDQSVSEEGSQVMQMVHSIYDAGRDDIGNYPLLSGNSVVDRIQWRFDDFLGMEYLIGRFLRIAVFLTFLVMWIHAMVRRNWFYIVVMTINLALFAAVVLTLPTVRTNYFFYLFFNMYWTLAFYLIQLKTNRRQIPCDEKDSGMQCLDDSAE